MDSNNSISRKPLRLWPGVAAAVLIVLARFIVPLVWPDAGGLGVLVAVAGMALIIVWWMFFSRARWADRIGVLFVMIAATFLTRLVVHPSIAGGGMGMLLPMMLVPSTLGPLFVAGVVLSRRLSPGLRRTTMIAAILVGCGVWTFARTDGIKGEGGAQLAWRWTPTAEQRLLAQTAGEQLPVAAPTAAPSAAPTAATPETPIGAPSEKAAAPKGGATSEAAASAATDRSDSAAASARRVRRAEWPGFRGPQRDGVIRGVSIDSNWAKSAPVAVWRRPIGPGWSSFAVDGDLVYTQEQRGEHEIVSSYRLSTGEPVWMHRDAVRFYESNGGAGPRGTPTLHNGRVYTLGATGILNALDANTGAVVWSRNAQADTGAPLPGWGFAGSPLVVDDLVIVATSGRLAAYDLGTGRPRWTRTTGGGGYSSPHLATIDGVTQILLPNGGGVTSVAPADGAVLWQHAGTGDVSILQPAFAADGEILVAAGDMMGGAGIRRLAVSRGSSGWTVSERWTSRGLKPYFNDFVVHKGHAFGFDGTILSCINIDTGERTWKGGRYGAGQMVLLPDQDMLLVLSEEGELALVSATADKFTEIAKVPAIEGKTWNHPVLIGDLLLVRNGQEMAAFRLPLAGTEQ